MAPTYVLANRKVLLCQCKNPTINYDCGILSINVNGFISGYWYDAGGERVIKASGDDEGIYVNDVFSGARTETNNFTAYINPYLVVSKGGQYTKHIYIGSQRIVSKLGDLESYGQDPRRIEYAGAGVDGAKVDYAAKYKQSQQTIKDNYAYFEVDYNGTDNDDYVNGGGFCCDDAPKMRSFIPNQNDNPELFQYYYHADHLGSSSLITNLDGEVVQHIEYVPFGEVFIEERNNKWNTPYLFNAKELDEETGLYYYGARYYDSRASVWLSTDPLQEKYPNISTYAYVANNPVKYVDPDGRDIVFMGLNGFAFYTIKSDSEFKTFIVDATATSVAIRDFSSSGAAGWTEVPMPNIIQTRPSTKENVSRAAYQANDYLIAAETGYFNQEKNSGRLSLFTEGGNAIPQDALSSITDLDPTLVKAISVQESHAGTTGVTDIMQVNVAGDWTDVKSKYSLEKGASTSVVKSLNAGIKMLGTKGFKGGITYDKKTGESTFTFQGWSDAAGAYNGGGAKNYQKDVQQMVNDSETPTSSSY